MRRQTFFLLVCLIVLAVRVHAQETQLGAEFRREGKALKESCGKFSLKSLGGCAQELFTGRPLHIAVGSIAPQNGVGLGPAFTTKYPPTETGRLNFNADAIVSPNGSWRAGVYGKAVYTKIKPGTVSVRRYPVLDVYAQATSLNKLAYYGLGPQTTGADRSFFGMRETIIGASLIYPAFKPLNMALLGEVNGRLVDIRGSRGTSGPSIEQVQTEATAPGLRRQPAFAQFGEGVRVQPALFDNHLRLNSLLNFQQFVAGDSRYSFRRLTVDLSHQIAFYKTTRTLWPRDHNGPDDCSTNATSTNATSTTGDCPRVTRDREGSIGLRLLITESFTSRGEVVPFYFQPTLGGSDINGKRQLASYPDYRFRAPNLMLLQGSIEHSLYGPLGVTFMAETGRVALRHSDLEFE